MNQNLVFNHHSLPFDSKEKAIEAIPEFLKLGVCAANLGLSTILVDQNIDKNWFRLELSNNFFWQDWYNQNKSIGNMNEEITAFIKIKTEQPFFSEEEVGGDLALFEIEFNGVKNLSALLAAAWLESPVLSFPTRNPWNSSPVTVTVNKMESENLVSGQVGILNLYSLPVFEASKENIIESRNALIKSGKKLLEKKNEFFQHIVFCSKAEEQLKNWSISATLLEQVKESLTVLNTFCGKWKLGEYNDYAHDYLRECSLNHEVSGESSTVCQTPKLRKEREFYLPDGKKKFFENHIKISDYYRIHFYPDSTTRTIYIGYIGKHLKLR